MIYIHLGFIGVQAPNDGIEQYNDFLEFTAFFQPLGLYGPARPNIICHAHDSGKWFSDFACYESAEDRAKQYEDKCYADSHPYRRQDCYQYHGATNPQVCIADHMQAGDLAGVSQRVAKLRAADIFIEGVDD